MLGILSILAVQFVAAYGNITIPRSQVNITVSSEVTRSSKGGGYLGAQINISANVTVNGTSNPIDKVFANITAPNLSNFLLQMINHSVVDTLNQTFFNVSFLIPLHFRPGNYTVSIVANNTFNEVNSSSLNGNFSFFINGSVNVSQLNITSENGTLQTSGFINITANVTGLIDGTPYINTVFATITPPRNLTAYSMRMTNGSHGGNTYNVSFRVYDFWEPGLYQVVINASDVAGKINISINSSFNVIDNTPPNVTVLNISQPGPSQISQVNITVNVTDNLQGNVSQVIANITPPNGSGSAYTLRMSNDSDSRGGNTYNLTFNNTLATLHGTWTVVILANDTQNNRNNTITTTYTVTDALRPTVTALNVTPPSGNHSTNVTVSVNVTDNNVPGSNERVDKVFANFTLNATFSQLVQLFNVSGTQFNGSFIIPITYMVGKLNVSIHANDTSGNFNGSVNSSFMLDDNTPPTVEDIVLPNGSDVVPGRFVPIEVRIIDNILINDTDNNTPRANITIPGTNLQEVLTLVRRAPGSDIYNATLSGTNTTTVGTYTIRIFANDTAPYRSAEFTKNVGNVNNSIIRNFIVANPVSTSTGGRAGGGGGSSSKPAARTVGALSQAGTSVSVKSKEQLSFTANSKKFTMEVATVYSKSVVLSIRMSPEQRYTVTLGQITSVDYDGGGIDFSVRLDKIDNNVVTLTLLPPSTSSVRLPTAVTPPVPSTASAPLPDAVPEEAAVEDVEQDVEPEQVVTQPVSRAKKRSNAGVIALIVLVLVVVGVYLYLRPKGLNGWKPVYKAR
ncbi:hypothetical protein HY486_03555 [Candidatus Woesearchaeota archaeon]|nr:hypothetical protein [Candidatus Woesearchaeota archaeon]